MNHARTLAAAAFAFATSGCIEPVDLHDEGSESESLGLSGPIRAVKWKQEMAEQDRAKSARFETDGLSYDAAAVHLAASGVTEVVLRVPGEEIFKKQNGDPDPEEYARWDNELVKMVAALKQANPAVRVYLWKRQWMQRRDSEGVVIDTDGPNEFATEMAKAIKRAREQGVDDVIEGVIAIETNIVDAASTRRLAVKTAERVNEETGGWLKDRTFMMPGAGMGGYFKGIDEQGGQFFDKMAPLVQNFSFVYKHMTPCESQNRSACSIQHLDDLWHAHVGKDAMKPLEDQVQFLKQDMGLGDLARYLEAHREARPALTHVTFWGDQGDGIILMSETNLAAVHQVLVEKNGWPDAFFNLPFLPPGTEGQPTRKYLFNVKADGSILTEPDAWDPWTRWSAQTTW